MSLAMGFPLDLPSICSRLACGSCNAAPPLRAISAAVSGIFPHTRAARWCVENLPHLKRSRGRVGEHSHLPQMELRREPGDPRKSNRVLVSAMALALTSLLQQPTRQRPRLGTAWVCQRGPRRAVWRLWWCTSTPCIHPTVGLTAGENCPLWVLWALDAAPPAPFMVQPTPRYSLFSASITAQLGQSCSAAAHLGAKGKPV